jgi:uncharacterized membrane protein (UPF0127 family)
MGRLRVVNTRLNRELGTRIRIADRWPARLRGMLARPAPEAGEGLMLTPCRSVHMFGMRYSLDIAFLNASGTVVALYPSLAPGSRTAWHREASHALELPSGTLQGSGTKEGDVLVWSAASAGTDSYSPTEAGS